MHTQTLQVTLRCLLQGLEEMGRRGGGQAMVTPTISGDGQGEPQKETAVPRRPQHQKEPVALKVLQALVLLIVFSGS